MYLYHQSYVMPFDKNSLKGLINMNAGFFFQYVS